jgi:hypothetical protein
MAARSRLRGSLVIRFAVALLFAALTAGLIPAKPQHECCSRVAGGSGRRPCHGAPLSCGPAAGEMKQAAQIRPFTSLTPVCSLSLHRVHIGIPEQKPVLAAAVPTPPFPLWLRQCSLLI